MTTHEENEPASNMTVEETKTEKKEPELHDSGTMEVLEQVDPMTEDFNLPSFNKYKSGQAGNILNYHTRSSFSLRVSSIPNYITQDGLRNLFSKYGRVQRAIILKSSKPRAGYVEYKTFLEAEAAVKALNKTSPHQLVIQYSVDKKEQEKQKLKSQELQQKMIKSHDERAAWIQSQKDSTATESWDEPNVKKSDSPKDGQEEEDPTLSKLEVLHSFVKEVLKDMKVLKGSAKTQIICFKGGARVTETPVSVPQLKEAGACQLCSHPAFLRCVDCGAWYCSRPCQAEDWENHVQFCKKTVSEIIRNFPKTLKLAEEDIQAIDEETCEAPQSSEQDDSAKVVDQPSFPTFTYDSCLRATLRVGSTAYLYFPNILSANSLFCMPTSDSEQLEELIQEMTDYGRSLTHTQHYPDYGEICLVKYSDSRWHRAVVLEVGDFYKCMLVDYPFLILADPALIRRIPPEFVNCLPFQAVPVRFNGIEMKPEKLEETTTLLKYLLCKPLRTHVYGLTGGIYSVSCEGINSKLKKEGMLADIPSM